MTYKIEEMKLNELEETLELVKIVFDEFDASYYTEEGIQNFYKFINYKCISKGIANTLKIFIAKDDKKIIGMICIRDYSHIAMLFVDKEFHKQGIGTKLIDKAKDYCKKYVEEITVNSSPYAIDFYQKIGFKANGLEKTIDGITFLPMKVLINNI